VSKPYPKEFRDDVVRVARNRGPDVDLEQIAKDFGIHFTTLYSWLKKADIEDGKRAGSTSTDAAELRAAQRRIKTLEQENEVLRRAAAYFAQAHLPGK
jgi:transposase